MFVIASILKPLVEESYHSQNSEMFTLLLFVIIAFFEFKLLFGMTDGNVGGVQAIHSVD